MNRYRFDLVTFLSDYGLGDEFVGVCHGVLMKIAPGLDIVDITHGISAQNVREGAMVLANSVAFMPQGVHLAVVDPGVGTDRLPVIVETAQGSVMVGPDNGLLALAISRLDGATIARKIENPALMLPKVARTFHGRDVFAPAAAHIARGVPLEEFGSEIPVESLVGINVAEPRLHDDHFHASVLHIDRFGNLQMNVAPPQLAELGLTVGSMLEVRVEGRRNLVPLGDSFSAVSEGELVATEDSYGLVALSVNCGSAADRLGANLGSSVIIGPPGSGAAD